MPIHQNELSDIDPLDEILGLEQCSGPISSNTIDDGILTYADQCEISSNQGSTIWNSGKSLSDSDLLSFRSCLIRLLKFNLYHPIWLLHKDQKLSLTQCICVYSVVLKRLNLHTYFYMKFCCKLRSLRAEMEITNKRGFYYGNSTFQACLLNVNINTSHVQPSMKLVDILLPRKTINDEDFAMLDEIDVLKPNIVSISEVHSKGNKNGK